MIPQFENKRKVCHKLATSVAVCLAFFLGFLDPGALGAGASNTVHIAAIYPEGTQNSDFLCITRAVVASANARKLLGNQTIEMEVFDSQNDVTKSGIIAQKIVERVKGGKEKPFDFVLGTRTSQEALAVSEVLSRVNMPFIATLASHPDVTNKKPSSVRMVSNSYRYARQLAKYTKEKLKPGRVVVLANVSQPFSQFYAEEYPKRLKSLDKRISIERYDFIDGYRKFPELAEKAMKGDPDLVYMPVYTTDAVAIYSELARLTKGRKKPLTLLSNGGINDGRTFFGAGEKPSENLTLIYNGIWNEKITGAFAGEYQSIRSESCKQNSDNMRTVAAFDTIRKVISVLEKSPAVRGKDFIRVFKAQRFDGLLGPLTYDAEGEPERSLELFEISTTGTKFLESYGG